MRYLFDITCPRCGGRVEHVAGGTPSTWSTRAVIRCQDCDATHVIVTELRGVVDPFLDGEHKRGPREHGTQRGYDQHRRAGADDPACAACLEAHRIHNKPSRDKWHATRRKTPAVPTPSTTVSRDIPAITTMSTGSPGGNATTIDVMENAS